MSYDPIIPNATTITEMLAARRGDVVKAGGPTALIAQLNADDGHIAAAQHMTLPSTPKPL